MSGAAPANRSFKLTVACSRRTQACAGDQAPQLNSRPVRQIPNSGANMQFLPPPELVIGAESLLFRRSFRVCYGDLQRCLHFIEPHDDNLPAFSHRTFELLLRLSTEFEAACKASAQARNCPLPKQSNIADFRDFLIPLGIVECEIVFTAWNPEPHTFAPFRGWSPDTPLAWYQSYNRVKHDRMAQFHEASLGNVCLAFSALFSVLETAFPRRVFDARQEQCDPDDSMAQAYFPEFELLFTYPYHRQPSVQR